MSNEEHHDIVSVEYAAGSHFFIDTSPYLYYIESLHFLFLRLRFTFSFFTFMKGERSAFPLVQPGGLLRLMFNENIYSQSE